MTVLMFAAMGLVVLVLCFFIISTIIDDNDDE